MLVICECLEEIALETIFDLSDLVQQTLNHRYFENH